MKISVVMPAYNEEKTIETTVRQCFETLRRIPGNHELVVTNDGSRDRTADILSRLQKEYNGLVVCHHDPNRGYGAALYTALTEASGDLLVSIDSDGQFDIAELADLLPQMHADIQLLTGYRRAKKDSVFKVFADRAMNLMIRCMFGVPYKDTNCAFKIMRRTVFPALHLEARGFQIPTEMVLKADAFGFSVREAPVNHYPRPGGQSSLAPIRTAMRMFQFLVYLRVKIWLIRSGIIRRT